VKTSKRVHLYHCDDCGKPITATPGDAVYKPGSRTLCARCVAKPIAVAAPKADTRGAAAKARWEAMSPEEQRAKVAKMQAARKAAAL
jgi:hypothetical protein